MQTKEQNWGSPGNKVIDQHGTNEVNLTGPVWPSVLSYRHVALFPGSPAKEGESP